MNPDFPADYATILKRMDAIDPVAYGLSRNFVNGAVTRLSPYLSRGVISTRQVLQSVLEKGHRPKQIETFIRELCWREYFQRVGQCKDLETEIRHPQESVVHHEMPVAVMAASTGVEAIDSAVRELVQTGYMHNHCRMYVASVVCNVGKAHWLTPARWLYYYLLDGDWASNACSWQWVAGTNSGKKYFANQENINRYTLTGQTGTFLDADYEAIGQMPIPEELRQTRAFHATSELPDLDRQILSPGLPTFVYNYYNLDPMWHAGEDGNRVLLLEPAFFERYPVSRKCLDFVMGLAANIPDVKVMVGSFDQLTSMTGGGPVYFKEHPLNIGYRGIEEPREWLVPELSGYFPSFSAFWKKAENKLISGASEN